MSETSSSNVPIRPKPLKVVTLSCHAHLDFALPCIRSWILRTTVPLKIRIYNDGSLTDKDCSKFLELGEAVEIVDFARVVEFTREKLKPYPGCAAYYEKLAVATKLFSIPLLEGPEPVFLIDSDVFAFEGLERLLEGLPAGLLDAPRGFAIFQQDAWCAYSFTAGYYLGKNSRPVERCCCGMMYYNPKIVDLALCEKMMQSGVFPNPQAPYNEQSIWSTFASHCDSYFWDPARVSLSIARAKNPSFVHYVSSTRHLVPNGFPSRIGADGPIRMIPSRKMSFFSFAWFKCKRAAYARAGALARKFGFG